MADKPVYPPEFVSRPIFAVREQLAAAAMARDERTAAGVASLAEQRTALASASTSRKRPAAAPVSRPDAIMPSPEMADIRQALASQSDLPETPRSQAFAGIVKTLVDARIYAGFKCALVPAVGAGGRCVRWLEVTRDSYDVGAPLSELPLKSARALLSSEGCIALDVLGRVVQRELVIDTSQWRQVFGRCIAKLDAEFSFCRGVPDSAAAILSQRRLLELRFVSLQYPFHCWRSRNCTYWSRENSRLGRCSECVGESRRLREMEARQCSAREAAGTKGKVNWRYLSPKSLLARARTTARQKKRRVQLQREVEARLNSLELKLNQTQSAALLQVTEKIETELAVELNSVLEETGKDCSEKFAQQCRDAWETDQRRNTTGCRSNRWSVITYRLALAVFSRSPAAYEKLKDFPVLNLPSVRQLQRVLSSSYPTKQGVDVDYLAEQSRLYKSSQTGHQSTGQQAGVLIFDETKVVAKVCWNSKTHEIFGLATTATDLKSLADVYKASQPDSAVSAEFALQFVWRDLTSNFDVLGPFWFAAKSLEAAQLQCHVQSAMHAFEAAGFEVLALVCDGASSNLSLLKQLCARHRGPFVADAYESDGDRLSVPCQFDNPFRPGAPVFTIICPTHMLKNCINALHSSRPGGTKSLQLETDRDAFGWQVISDMWAREVERRKTHSQLVPRLQRAYIIRDPWTKLNVQPAKIMVQDEDLDNLFGGGKSVKVFRLVMMSQQQFIGFFLTSVITELRHHLETTAPAEKRTALEDTIKYLQACRQLFERGLLSHEKVADVQSAPLLNIERGYQFFREWFESLEGAAAFRPTNPKERRFLAWQTWDLLRLSAIGFLKLSAYFHERFPHHYILPHRVNGSGVETVFSQVRQRVSSAVSSLNYGSGLAKLQASADCDMKRKKDRDLYRDVPLSFKSSKK